VVSVPCQTSRKSAACWRLFPLRLSRKAEAGANAVQATPRGSVCQLTEEGTVGVIEGVDVAVVEVSHQQGVAEFAEIGGCKCETLGLVELAHRGEALNPVSGGIENIHEAARHAQLAEGDPEIAVDVLNVVRGRSRRKPGVGKGAPRTSKADGRAAISRRTLNLNASQRPKTSVQGFCRVA